jgi:excinuclease ABC subunit C
MARAAKIEPGLRQRLKSLPDSPGVYQMLDARGRILYVGKAKVLKNRVRQYFQSSRHQDRKTRRLVSEIVDFRVITCSSELDALILENGLIKAHSPRYNIMLKDGKSYPFLKVTYNERFPRLMLTRKLEKDGGRYLGPFTSAKNVRRSARLASDLFQLKQCATDFTTLPQPPCIYSEIRGCQGLCLGEVPDEEYMERVEAAVQFLTGTYGNLLDDLEAKMKRLASEMRFEHAARLRDQITAVRDIARRQQVMFPDGRNVDVIGEAHQVNMYQFVVFLIREGRLVAEKEFFFEATEDSPEEVLSAFIAQYYHPGGAHPREVHLPLEPDNSKLIEEMLERRLEHNVKLKVPKRGEKRRMVKMACQNAERRLSDALRLEAVREEKAETEMERLSEILGLDNLPERIEGFDISNIGGSFIVGACVHFYRGMPDKKRYRRYKLIAVKGQDDFASMEEIILRRVKRLKNESDPPDLLLIDGGKGQVSRACKALNAVGLAGMPIVGLAKRGEELFLPGISNPLNVGRGDPGLNLLMRIRDEAHRFSNDYNARLRSKALGKSLLDEIPGIGPNRKRKLLSRFGSIKRLREADFEEIASTPGMNDTTAAVLRKALDSL